MRELDYNHYHCPTIQCYTEEVYYQIKKYKP